MGAPQTPAEPLLFQRILKEKVWGGDTLAGLLGVAPLPAGPLGETWELSDYPGEETQVRGGAWDGVSLRKLMEEHGPALLGGSRPTSDGRFPLLVKFIDAADDLSVQVHPPDGPFSPNGVGKTEAWYVVAAEPGAEVVCGLQPGTTPETFEPDAASSRIRRHLHPLKVEPGDCILVPAGMTHAILKGVVLCEVQQTNDVTFRMYDWDRLGLDKKPREVHVEQALQVIDYGLGPGRVVRPDFAASSNGAQKAELAECSYFGLRLHRLPGSGTLPSASRVRTLAVVRGAGRLESPDGAFEALELVFGDVALLPAGAPEVLAVPAAGGLDLLEGEAF